jgi:hypothetical protein
LLKRTRLAFAATGVVLGVAGSTVAAGAAQAAEPSNCFPNSVCVYEDVDFNHGDPSSAASAVIPEWRLTPCNVVFIRDGMATSFYNNTGHSYELWNLSGPGSNIKVGTMAPYKGYRYLTDAFNDTVDVIVAPGCLTA